MKISISKKYINREFSFFKNKRIGQLKEHIKVVKTYPEYPNQLLNHKISAIEWIIASEEGRACYNPEELLYIMMYEGIYPLLFHLPFIQVLYAYVYHKSFAGVI